MPLRFDTADRQLDRWSTGCQLGIIGAGTVIGVFAAVFITLLLRSVIGQLPSPRVAEILLPVLLLTACAIAATLVPAQRAAATDIARTIQSD